MKEISNKIISLLPYKKPFLFVDEITEISDTFIKGNFTFRDDQLFSGHFKSEVIIPGVLLIEVAAQLGLLCHYIYLVPENDFSKSLPLFASFEAEFLMKAELQSKLFIEGKKKYLRNNILKSEVMMFNSSRNEIMRMVATCKINLK